MLTFCRQCRAPKGAGSREFGPVACYRGAARTKFEQICANSAGGASAAALETAARARGSRANADFAEAGKRCFDDAARSISRIDGYESYILQRADGVHKRGSSAWGDCRFRRVVAGDRASTIDVLGRSRR
ncbi:hypothetical protein Bamb_4628 [Burkholderia ambifaria AMMD]|uniref:Uncharacterized protein n=1 Tax=Burkholderia ambifaria (strain ATCC BAA-244 / DSM 16087 / CCUG 44356 / LMG 19182 / AMMD) TaxID=339670 RepID=Q0B6P5_BURCM|nr:hypothetical protein Bamb_4628 [Burkholderia ambifaria AMMD]